LLVSLELRSLRGKRGASLWRAADSKLYIKQKASCCQRLLSDIAVPPIPVLQLLDSPLLESCLSHTRAAQVAEPAINTVVATSSVKIGTRFARAAVVTGRADGWHLRRAKLRFPQCFVKSEEHHWLERSTIHLSVRRFCLVLTGRVLPPCACRNHDRVSERNKREVDDILAEDSCVRFGICHVHKIIELRLVVSGVSKICEAWQFVKGCWARTDQPLSEVLIN